jgi:hypothetical protein
MSTSTLHQTTLTEEVATEKQQTFDAIVAGMVARSEAVAARSSKAEKRYITVLVTMPHVKKYGQKPTMSLTYGCSFAVTVGDQVLCPPTRLHAKWTRGVVTNLEGSGYRGPVKYVAALGAKKQE